MRLSIGDPDIVALLRSRPQADRVRPAMGGCFSAWKRPQPQRSWRKASRL